MNESHVVMHLKFCVNGNLGNRRFLRSTESQRETRETGFPILSYFKRREENRSQVSRIVVGGVFSFERRVCLFVCLSEWGLKLVGRLEVWSGRERAFKGLLLCVN